MDIRAILFDAGNTLIHIDPVRMIEIFREAGARTDLDAFREAELAARGVLQALIREGHAGTEPEVWREYFTALFTLSGVPEDALAAVGERVREVHARRHLWTGTAEGAPGVLRELRGRGYRLAVISNADGRVEQALEEAGLTPFLEFVIDSEVVGMEKPDPAIFHAGCHRLGLPPARCLYVGDLYPVDYLGARRAGLHAVLLDPLEAYDGDVARISSLTELVPWLAAGASGRAPETSPPPPGTD